MFLKSLCKYFSFYNIEFLGKFKVSKIEEKVAVPCLFPGQSNVSNQSKKEISPTKQIYPISSCIGMEHEQVMFLFL